MFNSPNQLGYFALLSASTILVAQKSLRLSTLLVTGAVLACSFLATISASKAALASIGLLGIVFLFGRLRTMIVAGLCLTVLIFTSNPFSNAIDRAEQRITTDQSHGFFEERGYDRIVNHPEYWFLGSGEGGYRRFADTTVIGSHELHSSLGTLFFCYGIVGTVLFSIFIWWVLHRTGMRTWMIFGAALAYGMTHQGVRFAYFWVLIAVIMTVRQHARAQRQTKQVKSTA